MTISMLVAASKSVTRREDPSGKDSSKGFPDALVAIRSIAFASASGFSSQEREKVNERVGETCWEDTVKDFERREAVGRLRLLDSVNVSLSIDSEMKSEADRSGLLDQEYETLRLRLLMFRVAVSEPVAVIEKVTDAMFDLLFCETESDIVRVAESLCEKVALFLVCVCVTLTPLVTVRLAEAEPSCRERVNEKECGADAVAVAALFDCSLTTPSALYGISQMSLPSNTPPAKVFRPRLT